MLQLNYKKQGYGEPVILIHGLFGNLDNLGLLARPLSEQFEVISIDVRNHGLSPRAPAMDYPAMAGDVLALLDTLGLDNVMLVGHSMGGKIAMQLAKMAPARVRRLVVLDMAPVAYPPLRHHDVFAGLQAVEAAHCQGRGAADRVMAESVSDPSVRQFLLKSYVSVDEQWQFRFAVATLIANYDAIMGWPDPKTVYSGPTLFLKGSESDYIRADDQARIIAQFPAARAKVVAPAGHWLHAEKPALVARLVVDFLSTSG